MESEVYHFCGSDSDSDSGKNVIMTPIGAGVLFAIPVKTES